MGTSRSAAELAKKLHSTGSTIPRAAAAGVKESGAQAQKTIYGEAAKKGVLPTSKIAKRPWGVRSRVTQGQKPSAFVSITGPFQLVESDTKLHIIAARRLSTRTATRRRTGEIALSGDDRVTFGKLRAATRTRRDGTTATVGGKQALTIGGNLRAYAVHHGTRGKGIFAAAKPKILAQSPPTVMKHVVADMAKVFA